MSLHRVRAVMAVLFGAMALASPGDVATAQSPPSGPPPSGPGSESALQWSDVRRVDHTFADPALNYTTFEPAGWVGAGPAPSSAPLVVFLHGYLAMSPNHYGSWVRHIVRQGNVVIFPAYQIDSSTPPSTFTDNAIWSIKDALPWLAGNATVKPETSRGMAIVGHSFGGVVSANLANRAAAQGLPVPKAVFLAQPYSRSLDFNLSRIPATTKIVCLVSDNDEKVGRAGCDVIWDRTGHIPVSNRNYALMRSDGHGTPALDAHHRAPSDADAVNALDWYGFWKLGDALRNCGFFGADCQYALGNTWEQTFMGRWSDGRLVNQLWVYTAKPADPFPDPGPPAAP